MQSYLKNGLYLSLLVSSACFANIDQAIQAFEQNDVKTATELFEKTSDNIEAKIYLARIYMSTDIDEAEDWIEDAVDQDDNSAEAHYWRGRIMGEQASNSIFSALSYAKKSKTSFAKAAQLEPSSIKYQTGLFRFHINAPSIAGGDKAIAEQAAQAVANLDKKAGVNLFIDLARSNEATEQVETLLSEGKETFSDLPDFYYKSGMHYQQQKQYADAIKEFAVAAEMNSDDEQSELYKWSAMYQIGRTAVFSKSDAEQGIKALQRYVDESPKSENLPSKDWAQFRLANLLELANQSDKAKQIYQRLKSSGEKDLLKALEEHI